MALIADNLRSIDTFELLLGLCAGSVEGFHESKEKSVHLDDTPIENFEEVEATLYQASPMGVEVPLKLGGQASNNRVSVELETNTPVVRRGTAVSPSEIGRIEVRLLFTSLYRQDEREGPKEDKAQVRIEYKPASSGAWVEVNTYEVSGKTTSNYPKEYAFEVPQSSENYDIRVTKLDPPEDDDERRALIYWESFQEVVPQNPNYKDLSMLHVVGRGTNQLSGVPSIWTDLKSRKVRVPTGYNPDTKTYSGGIWDGTFQSSKVYSTNPIWILYDLATDAENGVASYYNLNLDKFSAYQVARWCDEKVDDGAGGTQPRFTLNNTFQDPTGAKELLRYIAGLCASTFFDDGNGNAYLRADVNTDPVALFTPENVIEGEFLYSFSDVTTRHNDVTVEFVNPSLGWNVDRRRVFDQTSIDLIGRIPHDFTAIGCIDEREAIRRARHHVVTAQKEKQFVAFKTNRAGIALSPYDVFLVADPKVGYGITGRILSTDGRTIKLRDPVTLEIGHTYDIKFQVPNPDYPDSSNAPFDIVERAVTSADPGRPVTSLTVNSMLPSELEENAAFSIESSHIFGTPKRFRMLGVTETDGDQDIVQVYAVEVYVNKWAEILGEAYTDVKYSVYDPFGTPPAPTGLDLHIDFRTRGVLSVPYLVGEIRGNILPTNRYRISYRRDGGPRTVIETDEPYFEIEDIPIGLYLFSVQAIGKTGKVSPAFERVFSVKENLRDPNAPRFVALLNNTGVLNQFDLYPILAWSRGGDDAFVERYIITIKDIDGMLVNTYEVDASQTEFHYTRDRIADDGVGRTFQMCVSAAFSVTDPDSGVDFNQLSAESCITVNNPRPTIDSPFVRPKLVGSEIGVAPTSDRDYLRTVIWVGDSADFEISPDNMIYSGGATVYHYVHTDTKWFKIAVLDDYDPTDYDISDAIEGVPALIGSDEDGAELTPFANRLSPIVIVETVAEMNNFLTYADRSKIPRLVYVWENETLYRYDEDTHTYVPALGFDSDGVPLTPFANRLTRVVLVDTLEEANVFLTEPDRDKIPRLVYVEETETLYKYDPETNTYVKAVNVDDIDLSGISLLPSNVMPSPDLSTWEFFGTASRIKIETAPSGWGCLVLRTPGTGHTSGCRSPFIPVVGGETYTAGAAMRT